MHLSDALAARRPYCPFLETVEDRLPLGDTLGGVLLPLWGLAAPSPGLTASAALGDDLSALAVVEAPARPTRVG